MSQEVEVVVYYDFASSLCYVAHRVMERMAVELEEMGVELAWRPIDLTRITGWSRGAPMGGERLENARRVARELDVSVRFPECWPDSRPAGAVALALAGSVAEPSWRERVFSALHEQGRALDDPDLLVGLGRDLGLDAAALAATDRIAALEAESDRARAAEVMGVPTFLFGEWPIGGIQEPSVMRSLLGRWAAKVRRAARPAGVDS